MAELSNERVRAQHPSCYLIRLVRRSNRSVDIPRWAAIVTLLTVVAFIGLLSSISSLIDAYPWLSWLSFLEGESTGKKILQGLISGVLPPILLALLNMVLPFILRRGLIRARSKLSLTGRDHCARRDPQPYRCRAQSHDAILYLPSYCTRTSDLH